MGEKRKGSKEGRKPKKEVEKKIAANASLKGIDIAAPKKPKG